MNNHLNLSQQFNDNKNLWTICRKGQYYLYNILFKLQPPCKQVFSNFHVD